MVRLVSSLALAVAVALFVMWSLTSNSPAPSPSPTPAPDATGPLAVSPTADAVPTSTATPTPTPVVSHMAPGKSGGIVPLGSASGLVYVDLVKGTGAVAEPGTVLTVDYTGMLVDHTVFHTTIGTPPFVFTLGQGEVIEGWEEGVLGMRVGGERFLIVPPDLGYGEEEIGGVIPPNSILLYEVELLGVRR